MIKKKFSGGDITYFYIAAVVILVHCIVWAYAGNSPFVTNPYNSYVLQAEAWKDGSFDLGRNYSHLELAEYDYRFFVSFPPFPSVLYFPLVLLGIPVPEGLIALLFAVGGALTCYKLCISNDFSSKISFILSILMTCGSNMLFVSVTPWVWFIAQNMCFTFSVLALLFASRKQGTLAFLFWSMAIGCRPFQIVYLPVLCMLLAKNQGYTELIRKPYIFSGAVLLGAFYMWLNYARFGNIFEFGHNYLPEFTEALNGQFHISYLKENLYSLIRLPDIAENGRLVMQRFNGMNIFLASPVFLYAVYCFFRNFKTNTALKTASVVCILLELLFTTLHKTMGGWQFGNRYTNDCLPLALMIIVLSGSIEEKHSKGLMLLTLYGVLFNVVGTIMCYINA